MARKRMRYTGGINRELAQAFLQETGTKGVLITSLEYMSEGPPPRFLFSCAWSPPGTNRRSCG